MKTYDVTIIGFGITGMLVLAILKKESINNICIIDPYFDGGDLIRSWGDVLSNTPLRKAIDALQRINPSYTPEDTPQDTESITPLSTLVHMVKDFIKGHQYDRYETKVKKLIYTDIWTIHNEDLSSFQSKVIIACQGSEPRKLQCGTPCIPLHIALNKDLLKKYMKATHKVLVFGTSHSGTLVLENLEKLGVQTTAIYKKDNPFSFASDGDYDGIKEEAARIAKQILNNEYKNIQLVNIMNVEKVIKASKEATYIIYSIGFEARSIDIVVNENHVSIKDYDSKTGALKCPKAYGFGIAYPSLAPDNIHVDVGLYSFVEHIQKQIPNLKTYL